MSKVAIAYYHDLLGDDGLAAASRAMLAEELERAKLVFGGRLLSPYLRPHFLSEEEYAHVRRVCETLWTAVQKVKDLALEDRITAEELGLTPYEWELARLEPGYSMVSPTARFDSFLTERSYSFVELNGESPAGIAYADAAFDVFARLPVMRAFKERYDARPLYGRRLLLDTLLATYAEFLDHRQFARPPQIAIIDLKGLPTQQEFELFCEFFEREGYPTCICSPDELEFSKGKLRSGDFEIDIVYRRLLVNEYLPFIERFPALLDAYRARAVCVVNSFRSKLIHKKALFATLTDERYERLFDDAERAVIRAHVPWTRRVRDAKDKRDGEEIELLRFIEREREHLVLKPNDDYGGRGIFVGWRSSEGEWRAAIDFALKDGDYLVQERVSTSREKFPMLRDDGFEMSEQLVDLDPLLFNGKVGSAFARLSSTELANVSSGGGMVPTFIISDGAS